ncbi:MAG: dihydrofolate reductase family protein [Planctomycetota bacterium]|nr:dihydrofolate reductase family protein [Planctomycetota bacterium]
MKGSVFVACSLDGFIARPNGDVNWLPSAAPGEDFGYEVFMSSVDALVMGKNSFNIVRSFSEWPYKDKKVVVLSREKLEIPSELSHCVEQMAGEPLELMRAFSDKGWSHVYIDGGKAIQTFLNAGQIQQLIITRIPILLGEGIPLFGPLKWDLNLDHVDTKIYENGMVQSRYEVCPGQFA